MVATIGEPPKNRTTFWYTHLINQLTTMNVVADEDLRPKLRLTAFNEIAGLLLEHGVFVRDRNELFVTEALRVRNVCKVGITFLAEFTDNQRLIKLRKNGMRGQTQI